MFFSRRILFNIRRIYNFYREGSRDKISNSEREKSSVFSNSNSMKNFMETSAVESKIHSLNKICGKKTNLRKMTKKSGE